LVSPLTLPSPQRGEGRVRGPIVKKLNAFVLVTEKLENRANLESYHRQAITPSLTLPP